MIQELRNDILSVGYEASIPIQDNDFIADIKYAIFRLIGDIKYYLKKEHGINNVNNREDIEKVNKIINNLPIDVSSMLDVSLSNVSNILSDRFGVNIDVKIKTSIDSIIENVYTVMDPRTMNTVINNGKKVLDDLVNITSKNKKNIKIEKSIKGISEQLSKSNIDINLKTLYIENGENLYYVMYINPTMILYTNTTNDCIASMIIKNVGNYFGNLIKYSSILSDMTDVLDIHNNVSNIKMKLRNIYNEEPNDNDDYNIALYGYHMINDLRKKIDNTTDEDRMGMIFINKFNLTKSYTECIDNINSTVDKKQMNNLLWGIFKITLLAFVFVITLWYLGIATILLLIISPFVITITVVTFWSFILNNLVDTIVNLFNSVKNVSYEEELLSLKKIIVQQLRDNSLTKAEKIIYVNQLDTVNTLIKINKEASNSIMKIELKEKYNISDLLFKLRNNDLHALSVKLETIKEK